MSFQKNSTRSNVTPLSFNSPTPISCCPPTTATQNQTQPNSAGLHVTPLSFNTGGDDPCCNNNAITTTSQTQPNSAGLHVTPLSFNSGGGNRIAGMGAPAAVSWGGTRNDLFFVCNDNDQLYHLWSDDALNGGFGTESWGGSWAANQAVAATTWGPGRLDAFLIGQNHQLYHYWQDGGPAFGLEAIGGAFDGVTQGISAVSQGVGMLDVFLVRPDGQLDHWSQNTNQQSNGTRDLSWHVQVVGGSFSVQAQPSAISRGPGLLDTFLVGTDHQLYDVQLTNGDFKYISLGGPYRFDAYPASVHWGNIRADVFTVTDGGRLMHNWSEDGSSFGGELVNPTSSWNTSVHPSAISWGVGRLDLFLADPAQTTLTHVWQDSSVTGITWHTNVFQGEREVLFITAAVAGWGHFDVFFDGAVSDNPVGGIFEGVDHNFQ